MTTPEEIEKTRAPLAYHLEEFRARLWRACTALFVGFCVSYYFSDYIYAFLVQPLADLYPDPQSRHLIYTGLAEAFISYVHLSLFAGFFLAFPVIAYEFYMFLAPGMYKTERSVLKPYLIISPVLFFLGAALAYYCIFPAAWKFFQGFEKQIPGGVSIKLEARVSEYLGLVMQVILAFGLAFQLPVLLTLLARVGLVNSRMLASGRKYALLGIVVAAAFLTPPDVQSQIALSIPLYLLYELSIFACRKIEKENAMHDLKAIRENPAAFDEGMKKRGLPPQSPEILRLDEEKRARQKELEELLAKRNHFAKAIGMAKAKGEDTSAIMAESKAVNDTIAKLEQQTGEGGELGKLLATFPNILVGDVPVGADEAANAQVREHGSKPVLAFKPKEHFELGEKLGLMDFERAAKISGARFVVLKGQLARLERALAGFFLDHNTREFGYTEVVPPLLVRDNAVFGTGQLPKFGEDLFKTTNDFWLIPTSEVSLTNLVNDEIVNEAALPLRYTAYTPCFRSEAGAAGKDTRGMIRQHQFSKVELVSIVHPDKSAEEHERMVSCAESILTKLGLAYRVMLLCSGDTGFSARKTYDLEVWLPGQNAYREISSCSNCGDFQARRMKARFKPKEGPNQKKGGTQFVHTLNGSGLPIGRTIVAILENYQQADGSIAIPDALKPYMDNASVIK